MKDERLVWSFKTAFKSYCSVPWRFVMRNPKWRALSHFSRVFEKNAVMFFNFYFPFYRKSAIVTWCLKSKKQFSSRFTDVQKSQFVVSITQFQLTCWEIQMLTNFLAIIKKNGIWFFTDVLQQTSSFHKNCKKVFHVSFKS